MFRVGSIIRLIDVVLITLFGFLNITDFKNKSQIKLPSNFGEGQKQIQQRIIYLNIVKDTQFKLIDGQNKIKEVPGIEELEKCIVELNNACLQDDQQMIIVIEPDLETMIQTTVDVMDICEKHQVPKNLSYPQIEIDSTISLKARISNSSQDLL